MTKKTFLLSMALLLLIICMVINPSQNIDACLKGIYVWATCLVPALFPFFFVTRILANLGAIEKIGNYLSPITQKLFNVPGISGYVYAMSVISGYPVGAKITADLYENNMITHGQACRITSFTSTSGPLFVIGTVGVGMFVNKNLGIVVLISHIIGAFLNGLLYRNYKIKEDVKPRLSTKIITKNNSDNMLEDCMISSINSILIVGGYVAFFFMIISIINDFGVLHPISSLISNISPLSYSTTNGLLNGVVEMTKGCLDISECALSFAPSAIMSTALISFGGISISMQALTFLKKFKISIKYYALVKITQTLLSTCVCYIICKLFY